jgi:phosphoglycerate kinase
MLLESSGKTTIDAILAQGGSVILMSHLGRPRCRKYSLKHILKTSSGSSGKFVSDCIGQEAENAAAVKSGEVLLLENLRSIVRKKQEMLLS